MKEGDAFPDRGPRHAILITLFYGRKVKRVVTREDLKKAIAEECEVDHRYISDNALNVEMYRLRLAFQKFAPEFKIRNRTNIGIDIVKNTEIEDDSQPQNPSGL